MKFRGLGTALVTPWRPDGAFDEGAFEAFVDWQIEQGVNFLVPCGTTERRGFSKCICTLLEHINISMCRWNWP